MDSSTLSTLTRLVLGWNRFEFEDKPFLKVRGTAISTKMAPIYISKFTAFLESNFFSSRSIKPSYFKICIELHLATLRGRTT